MRQPRTIEMVPIREKFAPGDRSPVVLNKNERLALRAYAATNSITEATKKFLAESGRKYKNPLNARIAYARIINSVIDKCKDEEEFWDQFGLSLSAIAKPLREGMAATFVKPMVVDKTLVEAGPYADHPTRVSAAMRAAKLRGLIEKQPFPQIGVNANVGEGGKMNVTVLTFTGNGDGL